MPNSKASKAQRTRDRGQGFWGTGQTKGKDRKQLSSLDRGCLLLARLLFIMSPWYTGWRRRWKKWLPLCHPGSSRAEKEKVKTEGGPYLSTDGLTIATSQIHQMFWEVARYFLVFTCAAYEVKKLLLDVLGRPNLSCGVSTSSGSSCYRRN